MFSVQKPRFRRTNQRAAGKIFFEVIVYAIISMPALIVAKDSTQTTDIIDTNFNPVMHEAWTTGMMKDPLKATSVTKLVDSTVEEIFRNQAEETDKKSSNPTLKEVRKKPPVTTSATTLVDSTVAESLIIQVEEEEANSVEATVSMSSTPILKEIQTSEIEKEIQRTTSVIKLVDSTIIESSTIPPKETPTSTEHITSIFSIPITTSASAILSSSAQTVKKLPSSLKSRNRTFSNCSQTEFGCCLDDLTTSKSFELFGCPLLKCNKSRYGCCLDRITSATGPDDEGCAERRNFDAFYDCNVPRDVGQPCSLPKKSSFVKRYYFNVDEGRCTKFFYDGCDGNKNRFFTESECQRHCISPTSKKERCNLPAIQGECIEEEIERKIRWYHDPRSGTCTQFEWSGCGGNDNNFVSYENCQSVCLSIEPTTRHTITDTPTIVKTETDCQNTEFGCCLDQETIANSYDLKNCPIIHKCNSSRYGCCPDGVQPATGPHDEGCSTRREFNPFNDCKDVEDLGESCSQPMKSYFVERYSFKVDLGRCVKFIYEGCGGNRNRFFSEFECQRHCVNPPNKGHCALPPVSSTCNNGTENDITRWYHDFEKKSCVSFSWSGCGGNTNNFATQEDCVKSCNITETLSANGVEENQISHYRGRRLASVKDDTSLLTTSVQHADRKRVPLVRLQSPVRHLSELIAYKSARCKSSRVELCANIQCPEQHTCLAFCSSDNCLTCSTRCLPVPQVLANCVDKLKAFKCHAIAQEHNCARYGKLCCASCLKAGKLTSIQLL